MLLGLLLGELCCVVYGPVVVSRTLQGYQHCAVLSAVGLSSMQVPRFHYRWSSITLATDELHTSSNITVHHEKTSQSISIPSIKASRLHNSANHAAEKATYLRCLSVHFVIIACHLFTASIVKRKEGQRQVSQNY